MGQIAILAIVAAAIIVVAAYMYVVMQLRELHLSTNSRLDELLETTKSLARAEGFRAGQEDKEDRLEGVRQAGRNLDRHEVEPN
jgi:hypothetical protein